MDLLSFLESLKIRKSNLTGPNKTVNYSGSRSSRTVGSEATNLRFFNSIITFRNFEPSPPRKCDILIVMRH